MELHGSVAARASDIGVDRVMVSFSHEREVAVAFCVAVGL
jgi:phosphopantetheinyl transferase (holo-ACP synthase)